MCTDSALNEDSYVTDTMSEIFGIGVKALVGEAQCGEWNARGGTLMSEVFGSGQYGYSI